MGKLEDYRKEIDSIDRELVSLFEKRMNVALKVGQYKKERNLPIFHSKREEEVIEKNISLLNNKDYSDITRGFFENIMELSRSLQGNLMENCEDKNKEFNIYKNDVIGYQGVEGSFSEEALIKYFKSYSKLQNYEEFSDVFKALENNEVKYAILPIENSYNGAITIVYDLLVKYNFYIIGEECIKIDQHLMSVECSNTKFIIIGKDLNYDDSCNKVSIVFSLDDKAGTLYRLLSYFAENNINMIKIESRPNKHESWKYFLYVDFEGNLKDETIKNALKLIEKNSGYFKIIGNYKNSF